MQSLDLKTILSLAWLAVRRYKILAVLTFFAIFIPSVFVAMTKKPVYVARATVLIKENNYASSFTITTSGWDSVSRRRSWARRARREVSMPVSSER